MSNVQCKNILAMIFNEIKCHVNTFLGLVGGDASPAFPLVSAPVRKFCLSAYSSVAHHSASSRWEGKCCVQTSTRLTFTKSTMLVL